MRKRPTVFQIMRFSVVGGGVMLFFVFLNWLFGKVLPPQAAFLVSYPPAVALHFALNKWWTFGCQRTDTGRQIRDYAVMVVVTFLIQWVVFTGLESWTRMAAWAAAGLANAAQMIITFLAMQRRIFAPLRRA
jgi:putative flippase GtrA